MRIRIDDIKDGGLALDFTETPEIFPLLEEIAESEECMFVAPVKTRLRAVRIGEMIEIDGTVETRVRLSCSRCLKQYEESLEGRFALTFVRELPEVTEEGDGEEVELNAEEMGLVLFQGDEIDLGEAIPEQVSMTLPMRPLCRQECRGLCPECGADLNEGDCGCERSSFNVKFAALKDLKIKKTDK